MTRGVAALPLTDNARPCRVTFLANLGNHTRWIALNQRIRGDSLKHDTARGYNRARSDLDAGADKSNCGDPASGANSDRGDFQLEIFPSKIVTACAKIGALTDADIGFNGNGRETQDADVFPDPDVIADAQTPREGDVYVCPNHDILADFCAERTQDSGTEL